MRAREDVERLDRQIRAAAERARRAIKAPPTYVCQVCGHERARCMFQAVNGHRRVCDDCHKDIEAGAIRWCEGCLDWHSVEAFDGATTGRPSARGRSRMHMRCREWHRAHPGRTETGKARVDTLTMCVLCERVCGLEEKVGHYAEAHPERPNQIENRLHGWRRPRVTA
jgi:hypothetical protein